MNPDFSHFTRTQKQIYDFRDYHPFRCNILVFGLSGMGKSSFINNCLSTPQFVMNVARVREEREQGQCTKHFERYPFNDTVKIYDTWGFMHSMAEDPMKMEIFSRLIDGKIEVGKSFDDEMGHKVDQKRIIDVVIFVFDMAPQEKSLEIMKKMKEFYEIAKKRNKLVYIVLTKVDTYFLNIKNRNILIEKDYAHQVTVITQELAFKKAQNYILDLLGDHSVPVFPIINYPRLETLTNNLINLLKRTFIARVCDDHKRIDKAINTKIEYNVDLFRNEIPANIEYEETINPQPIYPTKWYHDDPREFVITDLKYKCVTLDNYPGNYRLFVTGSLTSPRQLIVGLFRRNTRTEEKIYFECLHPDERLLSKQFDDAFGRDYVPTYEFLGRGDHEEDWTSQVQYDPRTTQFLKLTFCAGKVVLYLKRKSYLKNYDDSLLKKKQKKKKEESSFNAFAPPSLKKEEEEDGEEDGEYDHAEHYGPFQTLIERTIQLTKQKQSQENELRVLRSEISEQIENERKATEVKTQELLRQQFNFLDQKIRDHLTPIVQSLKLFNGRVTEVEKRMTIVEGRVDDCERKINDHDRIIEELEDFKKEHIEDTHRFLREEMNKIKNNCLGRVGGDGNGLRIAELEKQTKVIDKEILTTNENLEKFQETFATSFSSHEEKFTKVHQVVSKLHKHILTSSQKKPPPTQQQQLQRKVDPKAFSESYILRDLNSRQVLVKLMDLHFLDVRWNLIYRGSRDGFKARNFHDKVDHQFRTVTIVLSDKGYIFGGYNPFRWAKDHGGIDHNVAGSFLFGLNCPSGPLKFELKNNTATIHCRTGYMATFGLGHDLFIADSCNVNKDSFLSIGSTYHDYGKGGYLANGGFKTFSVVEIEVYCLRD